MWVRLRLRVWVLLSEREEPGAVMRVETMVCSSDGSGALEGAPEEHAATRLDRVSERLCAARERWLAFARLRVAPGDAEDVVQAALARALDRVESLRDPDRVEAWFYPILRHAIADHLARLERGARLSEKLEREPAEALAASPGQADEDAICGCGVELLGGLTPDQREVMERVVLAEEPVSEAAAQMEVTPNAARVRLHRARRLLQERLEEHCGVTTVREAHDCACDC